MKRSTLVASVSASIYLCIAPPLLAAAPASAGTAPVKAAATAPAATDTVKGRSADASSAAGAVATTCLADLRAFEGQMRKDGYWRGGSDYGYGYPMLGYGYGNGMGAYPVHPPGLATAPATVAKAAPAATKTTATTPAPAEAVARASYSWRGRPGYEVRTLVASADILARHGQQQPCEEVLASARDTYTRYAAELRQGGMSMGQMPNWQQHEIATAQPVLGANASFRSDELVGTEVRNPKDVALGSVDDLVLSPQTGKIAYLVIGRGGIFGIDKKYVPVPWASFRVTAGHNLLVLDATKSSMDNAPKVDHHQFSTKGGFDAVSAKIDAYWKTQLSTKNTSTSGG